MKDISRYIDHTNLKPTAQKSDIEKLCAEAARWKFVSVCVNPCNVALAKSLLKGTDINVCTVIGFPLGANKTEIKVAETKAAIDDGCDEFDVVINIGALKDGLCDFVFQDIRAVVEAAEGRTVKVIIETGLLNSYEKALATKIAYDAGADFIKTCTDVFPGKATVQDVEFIAENIPDQDFTGIHASGGIRTYNDIVDLICAGAERIGTSAGAEIMKEIMEY